jgi:FkbM family methyltransferase
MNFSAVSSRTLLGRMLRFPLRLVPPGYPMPIMQGRLRGVRWIVGAGNHGCWLGSYEYEKRQLFERTVAPGSVVYDVGAHAGFYTLLSSVLVGPRGRVVAFEPLQQNLAYLNEHLRLNRIKNVTVIDAAVSDGSGTASFKAGPQTYTGRLESGGDAVVRTVSLDQLMHSGDIPPPDLLKVDVEGSELRVLKGARYILTTARPIIFLETHGRQMHEACVALLDSSGYRYSPIEAKTPPRDLLALPAERSQEVTA